MILPVVKTACLRWKCCWIYNRSLSDCMLQLPYYHCANTILATRSDGRGCSNCMLNLRFILYNSIIPPPPCSTMKVVFLLALVGFTSAFDFPEDWEAWKQVGDVCHGRANILVGEGSASVVEGAPGLCSHIQFKS